MKASPSSPPPSPRRGSISLRRTLKRRMVWSAGPRALGAASRSSPSWCSPGCSAINCSGGEAAPFPSPACGRRWLSRAKPDEGERRWDEMQTPRDQTQETKHPLTRLIVRPKDGRPSAVLSPPPSPVNGRGQNTPPLGSRAIPH